ncbi:probable protein phosphatase 2C 59 [Camellia sinensis]|uniref:probable protein phosphatase 2C 59 n=1 Tax=Camellia sinensis TaxID=4442 RepID=UPI0010362EF1|nr:probable protein phosphatase 2C 59 [Camellia sinensis]
MRSCLSLKVVLSSSPSQNGKFSYGYASSPRKRSTMEDFYETRIDGVDGEIVGLFGVFDGEDFDCESCYLSYKNCVENTLKVPWSSSPFIH